MRTVLHIIRKELIQLRRDRRMFGITLVAPVLQLLILGYAANLNVSRLPLVVCDMDRSRASRDFLSRFTSPGTFAVAGYVDDINEIDRYIDYGRAAMALVLPRGFEEHLQAGRTVPVQAIADGSESNSAGIGLAYAAMIVAQYSRAVLLERLVRQGAAGVQPASVTPEIRVWYNPALRSRNFMVPGVLAMILMIMTMNFTSLAVVREREAGTMEQLIVTPMRPWQLIVGKLAPFTLLGLINIILVLLVAALWFHIPVEGSVALLLLFCLLFEFCSLGLGLLVSTISHTQQQAMMTSQFFLMMPMIMLSGFTFPIENMPKILQPLTYLMPMRYFLVVVRGIFLKGIGMRELWQQGAALVGLGAVILTVAVTRFRKKLG